MTTHKIVVLTSIHKNRSLVWVVVLEDDICVIAKFFLNKKFYIYFFKLQSINCPIEIVLPEFEFPILNY